MGVFWRQAGWKQSYTEERGVHDVDGGVQVSFLFILGIRNKKKKLIKSVDMCQVFFVQYRVE